MKMHLVARFATPENPLKQPEVLAVLKSPHFRYAKNMTNGHLSIPDIGRIPGDPESGGINLAYGDTWDFSQYDAKQFLASTTLMNAIMIGWLLPVESLAAGAAINPAKRESTYYTPGVSHPQVALGNEYDKKYADVEKNEQDINDRMRGGMRGARFVQQAERDAALRGPMAPAEPHASATLAQTQRPADLAQTTGLSEQMASVPQGGASEPAAEGNPDGDFELPEGGDGASAVPQNTSRPGVGDAVLHEARLAYSGGDYEKCKQLLESAITLGVEAKGAATALLDVVNKKLVEGLVGPPRAVAARKKPGPAKGTRRPARRAAPAVNQPGSPQA